MDRALCIDLEEIWLASTSDGQKSAIYGTFEPADEAHDFITPMKRQRSD